MIQNITEFYVAFWNLTYYSGQQSVWSAISGMVERV